MLEAFHAATLLRQHGGLGMDDPTEVTCTVRWYWNRAGQLCRAFWRDPCPVTLPIDKDYEQKEASV